MLIFQGPRRKIVYIHIPKNCGRYFRDKIKSKYTIIQSFWNVGKIDRAHIPYMLRNYFIQKPNEYRYISFVRNPYDRFISAFFYKFLNKKIEDLIYFIKNILPTLKFDIYFNPKLVHFYPQYMFLVDKDEFTWKIERNIEVRKVEELKGLKDYNLIPISNFNLKTYEYAKYFDQECINILNTIYEKDFNLFRYPMIQLMAPLPINIIEKA